MIVGREIMRFPKQLADIDFDPYRRSTDGLVAAKLERPAGVPIVTAEFRARNRHRLAVHKTASWCTKLANRLEFNVCGCAYFSRDRRARSKSNTAPTTRP